MRFITLVQSASISTLCCACAIGDVVEYTDGGAWADAAGADYTTIDFTGYPNGTLIVDQFVGQGALFIDGSDYIFLTPGFVDGAGLSGAFDEVWVSFSEPMAWLGIDFPGAIQLFLFADDRLIYSSSEFIASGTIEFGGVISDVPFDSVLIIDPEGDVFIDNLHFGPPIPAPATAAALCAALLMSSRRRRSR